MIVAIFFKPPERKSSGLTTKQKILEIDLVGAGFLICSIVCLLLALQWGGTNTRGMTQKCGAVSWDLAC